MQSVQPRYEYAIVEWIWNQNAIRVNLPDGHESMTRGTYPQVVEVLTKLGKDGWEVSTNAASGNWLFWTLKRTPL